MFRLRSRLGLCLAVLAPGAAAAADFPVDVLPRLPVVGVAQAVEVDLTTGFTGWTGGRYFWTRHFEAPGAGFLKVRFHSFDLAPGQRIIVSGTGGVSEVLTGDGPTGRPTFWSLPVPGSELTLRFTAPHAFSGLPFEVDSLMVGDPVFSWSTGDEISDGDGVCPPSDVEPAACARDDAVEWPALASSVAVLVDRDSVSMLCSGVVVGDGRVLTAAHCADTQLECADTVFLVGYRRAECSVPSGPDRWTAVRCGELLTTQPFDRCEADAGSLDFSLFSTRGDLPANAAVPDAARLTDGESVFIAHHPAGRPLSVSRGNDLEADPVGSVLRYSGGLDVAAGSAGAPVFRRSDGRLVGLHHCGGCALPGRGNRGVAMSAILPAIEPFLTGPPLFADGFESGDLDAWDQAFGSR